MKQNKLDLKNGLNELNNYGCKIEFLISDMRKEIINEEHLHIEKYLIVLKNILIEHENRLGKISSV